MPMYSAECPNGHTEDYFRNVNQRHDTPTCHCGAPMRQIITPTFVRGDLPGYESPVTGKWIEGRAARRDDLARTNSRPWEGLAEEKREARKRQKELEAKSDANLEAAIRRSYHELPPSKRRQLESA